MTFRFGFMCAAAFAGAILLASAPAGAQTGACAADDLRCRIERLEARLATLENTKAAPAAPKIVYESPTQTITTRRVCRANCQEEAVSLCAERGMLGGKADDWERPRSGPTILTRAVCDRPR